MKTAVTILLLPAALAWPSNNGHGHNLARHVHHHSSGSALPSGPAAGPFGMNNNTASQAATAIGAADSATSTAYVSLYSTLYQTLSGAAPAESAAVAPGASPGGAAGGTPGGSSGGAAGVCGGTVTVTDANTVTVTVSGGGAEAGTSAPPATLTPVTPKSQVPVAPMTPSSTAPEMALPPVKQSSVPSPVAPISQAASPVQKDVTPSSSSVPSTAAVSTPSPVAATTNNQAAAPAGSKRGLFIPTSGDGTQTDYVKAFNANPGKISWIVNQFSSPPPDLSTSAFEFVPQCYDKFSDKNNEWTTNAKKAVAAGSKHFLAFGEANTPNDQGFYMDAATAAKTFMTMLQPYSKQGVKIGSPGTLAMSWDIQWQEDFLAACQPLGCSISWISGHWFSPCGSASPQSLADTFYGTVDVYKGIAKKYGLKVWIDNFTLNCTSNTQKEFLDIVVPKLDADDMIERYGYVSRTEVTDGNGFLNTDGTISDLGLHYANM
ncbi:hypothetical protein N7G274_009255 [Stereocaulon virgatum]|uniref:Asl1-like glycosyl hydrolase catalytic domain-containing protein n=1 Tax=Stereocaulon virgatum TaxID=373712 RepID=A0ABR3ZXW9_9LECA